jgi:hypothetical protein
MRYKTPSSHIRAIFRGSKRRNGKKIGSLGQNGKRRSFSRERMSVGGAVGRVIRGMPIKKSRVKNGMKSTKNGKPMSLGGAIFKVVGGMPVKEKNGIKNGAPTKKTPVKKMPYGGKEQLHRKKFEQWLKVPERGAIYKYHLPRREVEKRGLGLIPKDTGSGYFKTWEFKKKLEDLKQKTLPKAKTIKERESIKQDIKLLEDYKKELEKLPHN